MKAEDKNIAEDLKSMRKSVNFLIAIVIVSNTLVALVIVNKLSAEEFAVYAAFGAVLLIALKILQKLSGKLNFDHKSETKEGEPGHAPVQENRGDL